MPEISQNNAWPDPSEFWRERRVTVTGGAGFLGQVCRSKAAPTWLLTRVCAPD